MKKLLYLIPLILIVLNLLSFSLYKDTVRLNKLNSLTPSHWLIASENLSASVNLGNVTPVSNSQAAQEANAASYVSIGSTFKGFPFGAYFSKNNSSNSPGVSSSFDISAYSILWIFVDGLLVLITLLIAFFINRRQSVAPATNLSSINPPVEGQLPNYPQQISTPTATPVQPNPQFIPGTPITPQQPLQDQPSGYSPQVITSSQPQQYPPSPPNSSDDGQHTPTVG